MLVEKLGFGLLGHIRDEDDFMYSRHACLNPNIKKLLELLISLVTEVSILWTGSVLIKYKGGV